MKAHEAAIAAYQAARDLKAESMVLLDLRGIAAFTDYFLICNGASPRQIRAIADRIEEKLKSKRYRLLHKEGYEEASWILLDYVDLVVHVFSPDTRGYYDLERLWADAPKMEVKPKAEEVKKPRGGKKKNNDK